MDIQLARPFIHVGKERLPCSVMVKCELEDQVASVQVLALPFIKFTTLVKLFNSSELEFSHMYNEDNKT